MRSQCLLLPLSQAARHIDDGVARNGHANTLKLVQQISRQRSSARAKLPNFRSPCGLQSLRNLRSQGLAEQARHLRCGDKVATHIVILLRHPTEFFAGIGVIAQAGGVERQVHELIKPQPAARAPDGPRDLHLQGVG